MTPHQRTLDPLGQDTPHSSNCKQRTSYQVKASVIFHAKISAASGCSGPLQPQLALKLLLIPPPPPDLKMQLACNKNCILKSVTNLHKNCLVYKWAFTQTCIKDQVLSIMHCALQKSAAIFLTLKNLVGPIALCNLFASAMLHVVVKLLFINHVIHLLGNTQ